MAFVVLEADGTEGTAAMVVSTVTAAFLPLVVDLARGLGGAVLNWAVAVAFPAAALTFVP